jgi:hypothetical protein
LCSPLQRLLLHLKAGIQGTGGRAFSSVFSVKQKNFYSVLYLIIFIRLFLPFPKFYYFLIDFPSAGGVSTTARQSCWSSRTVGFLLCRLSIVPWGIFKRVSVELSVKLLFSESSEKQNDKMTIQKVVSKTELLITLRGPLFLSDTWSNESLLLFISVSTIGWLLSFVLVCCSGHLTGVFKA